MSLARELGKTLAELEATMTDTELGYWAWLYRTEKAERAERERKHG